MRISPPIRASRAHAAFVPVEVAVRSGERRAFTRERRRHPCFLQISSMSSARPATAASGNRSRAPCRTRQDRESRRSPLDIRRGDVGSSSLSKISAAPFASHSARARAIHPATPCVQPRASSIAIAARSSPWQHSPRLPRGNTSSNCTRAKIQPLRLAHRVDQHQSCQPKYPPITTFFPVYARATRTAALIARAGLQKLHRLAHGTTLQNRSATSTSSTCEPG